MIDIENNKPLFDLARNQHISVDVTRIEIVQRTETQLTYLFVFEHLLQPNEVQKHNWRPIHTPPMQVNQALL